MVRLTDLLNDIQDGEVELEMTAVVSELYDEHAKVTYLLFLAIQIDFLKNIGNKN